MRNTPLPVQHMEMAVHSGGADLPALTMLGYGFPFRLHAPVTAAGPVQIGGSAVFPDTVGTQILNLCWSLMWSGGERNGGIWLALARTMVYRAAGPPATQPLFEMLLHLGCNAASGWPRRGLGQNDPDQTEEDLVRLIWTSFAMRNVTRADNVPLTYYKNWRTSVTTTPGLLSGTDGQCGAWCDLFLRVLAVQSLLLQNEYMLLRPSMSYADPEPRPPVGDRRLLIENWQWEGPPDREQGGVIAWGYPRFSQNSQNEWRYNMCWSHYGELAGIPGQGTPNPLSYFCNHQVVIINGTIYDASYGRTYSSVEQFDDTAVEAHGAFLGTADGCDYELFFTSRGESIHLEAVVTDWPVVPESQCFMSY